MIAFKTIINIIFVLNKNINYKLYIKEIFDFQIFLEKDYLFLFAYIFININSSKLIFFFNNQINEN